MSRAHAVMTNDTLDAHDASRVALGLAIVLALFVAAALSFAARSGEQTTPDEIAQFGD